MCAQNKDKRSHRPWPKGCVWPEPVAQGAGARWEADDLLFMPLDDYAAEMVDIKDYMDGLVEEGRLREDYALNPDFVSDEDEEAFEPEMGDEYWSEEEGFELWLFEEDLSSHMNQLKLDVESPVDAIERLIGYRFVNENLLRQAFTRRSFAFEHGVGDAELLEFMGDAALNMVVTRLMSTQLTKVSEGDTRRPFSSHRSEGDLSKIRSRYVCRENLAERARDLDLGKYVLLGSGDEMGDGVLEDTLEAIVGAVAVDSGWDWAAIENVVDCLLTIQLQDSFDLVQPSFYDTFNAWHQRKFSRMPEYEVTYRPHAHDAGSSYECTLRFSVPKNDGGTTEGQRIDVACASRGKAREHAAELAYWFVVSRGLWTRLDDAGVVPDFDTSINQLQELYQKGYVEKPTYIIDERVHPNMESEWECTCLCSGIKGYGRAPRKVLAKKEAALKTLVRLLKGAGVCKPEWEEMMWCHAQVAGVE